MGSLKFELIRKALVRSPNLKLASLCRIAEVSRAGYYYHLNAFPKKILKDQKDVAIITEAFEKSRRKAGIVTLDLCLRRTGVVINHKKIARLKRCYGLLTIIRRRNPYKDIPQKSGEHKSIPNLLNREFHPPLPDQIYSTDMTYLYYGQGEKAYLSATKDLCTNEIVSYKLMRSPLVGAFIAEFKDFLFKLPANKRSKLMIHSDQGFQYTHPSFQELLISAGMVQSMSQKGNCLDNAPIKTFFGHFKDHVDLKKCKTFEELQSEVSRTMNFYNLERPQKALDKKPPAEYRGLFSGFF